MRPVETLTPLERLRHSPDVCDALAHFRSPTMPADVDYALLPRLGCAEKPCVFTSLFDLARRIHRERGDDALELQAATVRFRSGWWKAVEVHALDQVADRRRRIGYAWIGRRPMDALKAALDFEAMAAADALQSGRAQ